MPRSYDFDLFVVSGKMSNKFITGIDKLAQIVTVKLLTFIGTKTGESYDGNSFTQSLLTSNRFLAQQLLSMAVNDTYHDILNEQRDVTYKDERLQSLQVEKIDASGDRLTAWVTLVSEAGTTVTRFIPIDLASNL